jgi:hypothetical protein
MSPNAHLPEPVALLAPEPNDGSRSGLSAVGEEVCSGCVEATRERGRLFFADFGSATASFSPSTVGDSGAERDLRLGWASPLPPLHSRHPQTLMPNGICVSVSASLRNPDRHLPMSGLLAATRPALPVPWACDRDLKRWGLRSDHPLTAPAYSERRDNTTEIANATAIHAKCSCSRSRVNSCDLKYTISDPAVMPNIAMLMAKNAM